VWAVPEEARLVPRCQAPVVLYASLGQRHTPSVLRYELRVPPHQDLVPRSEGLIPESERLRPRYEELLPRYEQLRPR
jgi:hypothetical protein